MSYTNLPYVVKVRVVYGSDVRKTLEFSPWRGIENEIDPAGNVDLFSPDLMKLIPSASDLGEDCELYAARLVKRPDVKREYIDHLLKEFRCGDYDTYCSETKTPPPRTSTMFFCGDSINSKIDDLLSAAPTKRRSGKRTVSFQD